MAPPNLPSRKLPSLSSDLTFLTNEPGNTLRDRFAVLLHDDTRFFDCLVGYFFISGFYKLYPSLEKVEKIRVLVGLRRTARLYDLLQRAREQGDRPTSTPGQGKLPVMCYVNSKTRPTASHRSGVHKFVEWVRSGKLEIKAHPSENLHAKVYIMTFAEGDRDKGRVITGSSNLTQSGLQDNLEFNVELRTALTTTSPSRSSMNSGRWRSMFRKPYEDTVVNRSPFAHFTPYELYLKFLYEYFRDELNRPMNWKTSTCPTGFKRLKYQEEAVLSARKVLEEYGGAVSVRCRWTWQDVHGGTARPAARWPLTRDCSASLAGQEQPRLMAQCLWRFPVPHTDFESIGKLDDLARARRLQSTPTSSSTSRTASAPRQRRPTKCSRKSVAASA